jgi:tRNA A-37 threonylcarbamoyl transferase component Bud32
VSIGTWQDTSTADGRKVGALALPQQSQEQLTRVAATVSAVRRLNLPGVVPVADLVGHEGRAWLVAASPVGPNLADLTHRLSPGVVATVLSDTGQTLMKLHAAGVFHGSLDSSTVVVSPAGVALLSEVGVAAATAGRQPTAKEDSDAWAALARTLGGDHPTLQAVAAAAAAGLETGLRVLAANASTLPGFGDRAALAAAPHAPAPVTRDLPPEESTTLLPNPSGQAAWQPAVVPQQPVAQEDLATRMGRGGATAAGTAAQSSGASRGQDGVLRFGQGPVVTPTTPQWTPPPQPKPKRRVARRIMSALGTLIFLLALLYAAGVLLGKAPSPQALLQQWGFLNSVQVSSVTVAKADVVTCNSQADVVGTVVTNGEAGVFAYEWVDSDGHSSGRLNQTVRDGQGSVAVHYYWNFSGKGTHKGTATLRVLAPNQIEATAPVSYTCK